MDTRRIGYLPVMGVYPSDGVFYRVDAAPLTVVYFSGRSILWIGCPAADGMLPAGRGILRIEYTAANARAPDRWRILRNGRRRLWGDTHSTDSPAGWIWRDTRWAEYPRGCKPAENGMTSSGRSIVRILYLPLMGGNRRPGYPMTWIPADSGGIFAGRSIV